MIFVYAGFALTVGMGIWMQKKITVNRVAASAVGSTLLFFVITNFGAWMMNGLYPMTAAGLMQSYVAGLPFLQNSLLGNLAFAAVMFGGFALVQRQFFYRRICLRLHFNEAIKRPLDAAFLCLEFE